jgi:hypothetical protein
MTMRNRTINHFKKVLPVHRFGSGDPFLTFPGPFLSCLFPLNLFFRCNFGFVTDGQRFINFTVLGIGIITLSLESFITMTISNPTFNTIKTSSSIIPRWRPSLARQKIVSSYLPVSQLQWPSSIDISLEMDMEMFPRKPHQYLSAFHSPSRMIPAKLAEKLAVQCLFDIERPQPPIHNIKNPFVCPN